MHLIFHVHGAWGQERPVLWAHNHHTIYGQLMGWRLYTELMGVNFIPNLKLSIFLISPFKIEERYNKLTLYWCVCVCVCVCARVRVCVFPLALLGGSWTTFTFCLLGSCPVESSGLLSLSSVHVTKNIYLEWQESRLVKAAWSEVELCRVWDLTVFPWWLKHDILVYILVNSVWLVS
jgi:hypothetical protein